MNSDNKKLMDEIILLVIKERRSRLKSQNTREHNATIKQIITKALEKFDYED